MRSRAVEKKNVNKNLSIRVVTVESLAAVVKPTIDYLYVKNRLKQISLNDALPYITCFLCRGFLIEATTIVECLHTYCHSCLIKQLQNVNCCPQCNMSIVNMRTSIRQVL